MWFRHCFKLSFLLFTLPIVLFMPGLAPAAELSVSVAASPGQITQDEKLTYRVTLLAVKTGDSEAVNQVTLSYGFPSDFELVSVESSEGECEEDPIVQCEIGDVTTSPVTVEMVFIPREPGNFSSNIIVSGTKLDDNTGEPVVTTITTPVTSVVAEPPELLPTQLDFSPPEYLIREDKGLITLTVTRTGQGDHAVSVTYATSDGTATAGQDYEAVAGSLMWEEGDKDPKSISVVLLDDQAVEQDEAFNVTLSDASNATVGAAGAVVTITDDETAGRVEFSTVEYRVFEDEGQAEIVVMRSDGGDGPLTVNYATSSGGSASSGEDYVPASGTLAWQDQDTAPKSFIVQVLADDRIEGEETVRLSLNAANQSILGQRTATLVIQDNISAEDAVAALMDAAQNPTQQAMAQTLGTLCQSGRVGEDLQARCRELIVHAGGRPSEVANALQQIAPEEYFAAGRLATQLSARQGRNIYTRLMAVRSGMEGGVSLDDLKLDIQGTPIPKLGIEGAPSPEDLGAPVQGQLPPGKLPPGVAHEYGLYKLGGFINGSISIGDRDSSGREAGYEFQTLGITAGADYRISDQAVVGAALGYGTLGGDFYASGGDLDAESHSISLYGTYYQPEVYYLDAILGFGQSDYDLSRNISYNVGDSVINQVAGASPNGEQILFSLSGGYHYPRGDMTLTPTFRLDYIRAEMDPFEEELSGINDPGKELGLELDGLTARSVNIGLGGQVAYSIQTGDMTLVPEASLEWVFEMDNDTEQLSGRFLHDAGGTRFVLDSDEPDSNYFALGLGLSLQYAGGQSAFLRYETLLGLGHASLYSIMAGIRLEF